MSGSDPRLDEILADYLEAEARGEAPSRDDFLARHPEQAERLGRFLDNEHRPRQAMQPDAQATVGHAPGAGGPAPARYVGDYELLGEVARGAMGVVYRARQISLNRVVAVKMVLAGEFAGEDQLRRFRAEAETAAGLDHPNIVPVYEVGVHEGHPYFSMKFIQGKSLAALVGESSGQPRRAAELIVKVARAVHHAHQHGVLHRDLKPSNILLDESGEPHVADFGLARRGDGAGSLSGQLIGTPAYMAPEQARGEKGLTVAADVWVLGAILHECLTGKPPLRGENVLDVLAAVVNEEPAPGHGDLGVVALKCLRKEPAQRYESAAALADDLERWLRGEPVAARPAGRVERLWRWARREPVTATLLGALALSLVLGVAVAWWLAAWANWEAEEKAKEAWAARKSGEEALANLKVAREKEELAGRLQEAAEFEARRAEDARHALQIDLALRACRRFDAEEAERLLGEVSPRLQRAWETQFVRGLCRRTAMPLRGHRGAVRSVAYSPDGSRIVSGGDDRTVRLWDARTGRELRALSGQAGSVSCVAFSPDSRLIVSGSRDNSMTLWDARTGEKLLPLKRHTGGVNGVAFSPDGRHVASGGRDKTLKVWDVQKRQDVFTLGGHTGNVCCVAYSPDGRWIASGDQAGTVRVWDAEKGHEKLALKGHTDWVSSVCFSPDGKRIASASADRTVRLWGPLTGKELLALRGLPGVITGVAFSPDGTRLASVNRDGSLPRDWGKTVRVWDAHSGQEMLSPVGHAGSVTGVAFSPDGKHLATASYDSTVRVWDTQAEEKSLLPRGHINEVLSVAYSPAGGRFATSSKSFPDGGLRVWDDRTGLELLCLRGHREGPLTGVAFSPNGNRLVSCGPLDGVLVWDARTGQQPLSLENARQLSAYSVAYSPDGKHIAGSGPTVDVWDARTCRRLWSSRKHRDIVWGVAFSPDGKLLASPWDDSTVKVWDVRTGENTRTLRGHNSRVVCVAFSPDGTRIASGAMDDTVKVWGVSTGKELLTLAHKDEVAALSFSPDGTRIASGAKNALHVWDTRTGQRMLCLGDFRGPVVGVAFSPDGRRIACVSYFTDVSVWGGPGSRRRAALRWHEAQAGQWERAKEWGAAAFHLERLDRAGPRPRARLLAALKMADDTPLTRAVRRNLIATDAARAAGLVGQPGPAPLSVLAPP